MSTISEEVTLSVQMGEPCTICSGSTLDLALASSVGEPVMSYDVVLSQLTGSFLNIVLTIWCSIESPPTTKSEQEKQ